MIGALQVTGEQEHEGQHDPWEGHHNQQEQARHAYMVAEFPAANSAARYGDGR